MKLKTLINVNATAALLLSFVTACSVEDTHDLSKDIDMTVAVGNGISFPLGSTEQIKLTEMIDPDESDVLITTSDGDYIIEKTGEINATNVEVEKVVVELDPVSESGVYTMESEAIQHTNEYLNSLPPAVRDQIINSGNNKFTHVVNQVIDENSVKYTLKMDAPDEVEFLEKVMFEKPVKMTLDIEIYTKDGNVQFTEKISKLHPTPMVLTMNIFMCRCLRIYFLIAVLIWAPTINYTSRVRPKIYTAMATNILSRSI